MRNTLFIGITLMLAFLSGLVPRVVPAHASALSTPAQIVRQFSGTATTTPQTIVIESTTGNKRGPTASVQIANDETAGGSRLWVNFAGTAADPGTSFAESNSFEVKAGERFNVDGQFTRMSVRTAASTAAIRVIVSF